MTNVQTFVKLPAFVKEWLIYHYGWPVKFPDGSVENSTIRMYLQTLPEGKTPAIMQEGETAIYIPESKYKPTITYNYLSQRGKLAVIEAIEDNFRRCLWNELWELYEQYDREGKKFRLLSHIRAWCEMHGIDVRHAETVKQRFYRIRDQYRKKGVDYILKSRKCEENS